MVNDQLILIIITIQHLTNMMPDVCVKCTFILLLIITTLLHILYDVPFSDQEWIKTLQAVNVGCQASNRPGPDRCICPPEDPERFCAVQLVVDLPRWSSGQPGSCLGPSIHSPGPLESVTGQAER